MPKRARSGRAASVAWMVAAAAISVSAAGCGSSSSASSTSAPSNTPSTSSASKATLGATGSTAQAAKIATLAGTKLLYGPTTGAVTPSQLRAPTAADIKPFPFTPGGTSKTVAILSCSPLSATCVHMAALAQQYLAKLGFKSTIYNSNFTPAGNEQAMSNAIAIHPAAIYDIAVSPVTVLPEIAKARAAGIKIVYSAGTAAEDKGGLDGYVPQGSNLYQAAAAAQLVIDSKGKAAVQWLTAPEYPELEVSAGIGMLKSLCPGCKVSGGTETAAQVTAPVSMGTLITSLAQANPNLDYIELASACADIAAAAQAAKTVGHVVVSAAGCGASGIAAMNAGNLPFATGAVEPWAVLDGIDQILRLLAGKPAVPATELGPAAYLVTPATTPDHSTSGDYGKLDRWTVSLFNYVAPFSKAWGVNLSGVIADEK